MGEGLPVRRPSHVRGDLLPPARPLERGRELPRRRPRARHERRLDLEKASGVVAFDLGEPRAEVS
ncbi:MAG TPA: hypothetical protein VKR78_00380, partial [Acidimicrobiales bacterium]|nr:hypothetical protein [Acidimicrobiales bacterium]